LFLHLLHDKEHKEAFLELAHVMAEADGFISGKERGYMQSFMYEMNMEREQAAPSEARELSDIIGSLRDDHVKSIFFMEILLLMHVDGDYNDEERQVVKDLKQLFGFSDEKYEAYRDWVIRMDRMKIEGMKLILDAK